MRYYIGTSGYYYRHWYGVFYPPDLPLKEMFDYYQTFFRTVEINSTFYHLLKESSARSWYQRAENDFVYSVKMWRRITHLKKLKNISEDLELFYQRLEPMRSKVKVILIQLPPSLKKDLGLLEEFVEKLRGYQYAIEFRNSTWADDNVLRLLQEKNIAFCNIDMPNLSLPYSTTATFNYIRFHGYGRLYGGDYPKSVLEEWAGRIRNFSGESFIYFNNDFGGYAVKNALELKELLL